MATTITDEQFAARELVRDWAAGSGATDGAVNGKGNRAMAPRNDQLPEFIGRYRIECRTPHQPLTSASRKNASTPS